MTLLLFRWPTGAQSQLRGPRTRRAGELPGGDVDSAPALAPSGVPHDSGRGVQLGMAASLSEKKLPQQFLKGGETGKEAFARRRCRGQGATRSGSAAGLEASPCSAESGRQRGIRGAPRGPPGSSAGSGTEESFPGYSPALLRTPLHPRGGRSQQR